MKIKLNKPRKNIKIKIARPKREVNYEKVAVASKKATKKNGGK